MKISAPQRFANKSQAPKQGQEPPKPEPPSGDAYFASTSKVLETVGPTIVSLGAGLRAANFLGSLGSAIGSQAGAPTVGRLLGTGIGAFGGSYVGRRFANHSLEIVGEMGSQALDSNPNLGKAAGQALWLGATTGLLLGLPSAGLTLGASAMLGAFDSRSDS